MRAFILMSMLIMYKPSNVLHGNQLDKQTDALFATKT